MPKEQQQIPVEKKLNLELSCPKENLIRTILERKNS